MLAAAPPLPVAIAFRDPAHGVLATTRGVEETRDGGRTWRVVVGIPRPEVPRARQSPCPPLDAAVRSSNWFLCIGQGGAGRGEKAVYHGSRRTAWTGHGITAQGYAVGIAMARDGFGIIWESRGPLLVTRDGGVRWLELPNVGVPEVDFGITGAALPHGHGWVVLARGNVHRRLLETGDAGRTWHVVHRWN